jgi:hypothetical protein
VVEPSMPSHRGLDGSDRGGAVTRRWLSAQFGRKQATHGIYADIIVLAVILALQGEHSETDITSTLFGALLAVLLAEAYADYLGTMIGTGRRPSWPELRSTLALALGSIVAVIPPIVLLMLGVSGVIGLDTGFAAAKGAGVAVIGAYAYAANRRAGLSRLRSVLAAAFLVAIAAGLVLLKHEFH